MHMILIMVKAVGRHGVTEEEVLGVGQEMSPQTGRKHPRRQRQPGAFGEPCRALGGGSGPRRGWQGPTKKGLDIPGKSLDFTAGGRCIQSCLLKCPLAATAQSRHGGGCQGGDDCDVSHQADRDAEGVTEGGSQKLLGQRADRPWWPIWGL